MQFGPYAGSWRSSRCAIVEAACSPSPNPDGSLHLARNVAIGLAWSRLVHRVGAMTVRGVGHSGKSGFASIRTLLACIGSCDQCRSGLVPSDPREARISAGASRHLRRIESATGAARGSGCAFAQTVGTMSGHGNGYTFSTNRCSRDR